MKSSIKVYIADNHPDIFKFIKSTAGLLWSIYFKYSHHHKKQYICPICSYRGAFMDYSEKNHAINHNIMDTQCPKCGLYERHRLQYLAFTQLSKLHDFSGKSILHFAPELAFERIFNKTFAIHHTADISMKGVDYKIDLCNLPFEDETYDVIYASHVLEHIKNDNLALSEINRVLTKNGVAILPVPVVSPHTIEYTEENPYEFGHVRAIGSDYFNRYKSLFKAVKIIKSDDFDDMYQLYTYEDRSCYPTNNSPYRVTMVGSKHIDYVPICYK